MDSNNNNPDSNDSKFPTMSYIDSQQPAVNINPKSQLGNTVDRYKLIDVLGEGGFGIVYLAQQEQPIKRKVALKIIKPGMDSKQVLNRFEAERQALTLFDHPNIAKILDAGATTAGMPYFVMEYIEGIPITKYCDREHFKIEERLNIFKEVCNAIHYAHQKGIIHRDLKPSNILVAMQDKKAVAKVIDFGIAKAMDQSLTDNTFFTERGTLLGTPEYMSPEQAGLSIQEIDTRTDIYSLGVILYELLAGVLPFEPETLRQAGYNEIQRIIREVDPQKPSTKLSGMRDKAPNIAKLRRIPVTTLTKRLSQELEWIPMMALRKERNQRYTSASEFEKDIHNYLTGNPLIAGPESVKYKITKFVYKNKSLVIGSTAFILLLLASTVTVSYQAIKLNIEKNKTQQALNNESIAKNDAEQKQQEAEKQKNIAEQQQIETKKALEEAERQKQIAQAINEFLTKDLLSSVDPENAQGKEVLVRDVLDIASQKIENRFENAPLVEAAVRKTLGNTYEGLGRYNIALEHIEPAFDIYNKELGENNSQTINVMANLSSIYYHLNMNDKAILLGKKVLEIRQETLGLEHPLTTVALNNLASLYSDTGKYKEAEILFLKILKPYLENPDMIDSSMLNSINNLAQIYTVTGRYEEAEKLFTIALEHKINNWGKKHPDTIKSMLNLALLYKQTGQINKAENLFKEIISLSIDVWGEEHPITASVYNNYANFLSNNGKYDDAITYYNKAIAIEEAVLGGNHLDTLITKGNLADIYTSQGLYDKAKPVLEKVYEEIAKIDGKHGSRTLSSLNNLAILYSNMGYLELAKEKYIEALQGLREVDGNDAPNTIATIVNLAIIYKDLKQYDQAKPLYEEAMKSCADKYEQEHSLYSWVMRQTASFYEKIEKYQEAEILFLKAIENYKVTLGIDHPTTLKTINNLASLYLNTEQYEKAEPLFIEVLDRKTAVLGEMHPATLVAMIKLSVLYKYWGKLEQAEVYYSKALAGRRKVLGDKDPQTLLSIHGNGTLNILLGRYDRAELLLKEAVMGRTEVLGKNHPDTLNSIKELEKIYTLKKTTPLNN